MFNANSEESKALERAVVAKMMTRLIPFLAILYVFCLLDRGNVSIAALTMQKDLAFSDKVYGLGNTFAKIVVHFRGNLSCRHEENLHRNLPFRD